MSQLSDRCKEEVASGPWYHTRCQRKAVRDGWCTQHHPETVAARRQAASVRYKEQQVAQQEAYHERRRATVRDFFDTATIAGFAPEVDKLRDLLEQWGKP